MKYLFLLALVSISIAAQSQTVDPAFNHYFRGPLVVSASARQDDGKILLAGSFNKIGANGEDASNGLLRLHTDGTRDYSFAISVAPNNTVKVIIPLVDGEILVAGYFNKFNGIEVNNVVRLNTDGSMDNTFLMAPLPSNFKLERVAVQNDGKFLVYGVQFFPSQSNYPKEVLIRVNEDGTIDDTFNQPIFENLTGGYAPNLFLAPMVLQADGKILVGGQFSSVDGVACARLARINADGTLDESFNTNLGSGIGSDVGEAVLGLHELIDNKILVSGNFNTFNEVATRGLIRLNADGTLDNTFSTNIPQNYYPRTLTSLSDGRLLIANENSLKLLTDQGALDAGLSIDFTKGVAVLNMIVEPTGSVKITGEFSSVGSHYLMGIFSLNSDLSIDTTFDPKLSGTPIVKAIHPLSTGEVLIGGTFYSVDEHRTSGGIVKLLATGEIDPTFLTNQNFSSINYYGTLPSIHAIQEHIDGKILVGGLFSQWDGSPADGLVRLNADGSKDATFTGLTDISAAGLSNNQPIINALMLNSNNRVLIGGNFSAINGTSRSNFAQLNTDGSLDVSFPQNGSTYNEVLKLDRRLSDSLLLVTQAHWQNEVQRPSVNLVDKYGEIQTSLSINSYFNNGLVEEAIFLPDGNILIGGNFGQYNGTSVYNLVKIDVSGNIDNSFSRSHIASEIVSELHCFNGFIHIGQRAESDMNSMARRLLVTDSLGNNFNFFQVIGDVNEILSFQDNSILIGGNLSNVFGSSNKQSFIKINFNESPIGSPHILEPSVTYDNENRAISFSWEDNVIGELYFEIQHSENDNTNYVHLEYLNENSTSITIQFLRPNVEHFFRVRGLNMGGRTPFSNEISFLTPKMPPSAPNNLNYVDLAFDRVTVKWMNYSYNNQEGFEIWRSNVYGQNYELVDTVGASFLQYTDTALLAETTYFYKVRAYNSGGTSEFSQYPLEVTTPTAPPRKPTDLRADAQKYDRVTLTWKDNSDDEESFMIERSKDDSLHYSFLEYVGANDTIFVDSVLYSFGEEVFYYRVASIKSNIDPQYSDEVRVMTPKGIPIHPSLEKLQAIGPRTIHIKWRDNADNEDFYRVYVGPYELFSHTPVGKMYELPANSTEFLFEEGRELNRYMIYVVAVNEVGESYPATNHMITYSTSYGEWSLDLSDSEITITERSDAVAFTIGDYGYVGLGRNETGNLRDFWRYNPIDNSWTQMADFPGSGRIGAVAFSINGIGYVGTGNDYSGTGFRKDFYAYDPVNNSWEVIADFPTDYASGAGITEGVSFAIGDYAYVGLGNTGLSNTRSFFRYDPSTDTWQSIATFEGLGRTSAVAYSLNGKGYVAYGWGGLSGIRDDIWEYDPITDTWKGITSVNIASSKSASAASFSLGNRAFIIGGEKVVDETNTVASNSLVSIIEDDTRLYTEATGELPGMPRTSGIAFTIGKNAYVGFGKDTLGTYLSDLYSFKSPEFLNPKRPSGLVVESNSDNSLLIRWFDNSDNEEGFVIYAESSANPNVSFFVDSLSPNTTSYIHENLESSIGYRYRIEVFNPYGAAFKSIIEYVAPGNVDNTPINISAKPRSPKVIRVYWDFPEGIETSEVEVFVSTDNKQFSSPGTSFSTNKYVDLTYLKPNTEYYFTLRTISSNYQRSSWSDTVRMATPTGPIPVEDILIAHEIYYVNNISWKWTGIDYGDTQFRIFRSTEEGEFEELGLVDELAYEDYTFTPDVLHTYKIQVENKDGTAEGFIKYLTPHGATEIETVSRTSESIKIKWLENSSKEIAQGIAVYQNGEFIKYDSLPANVNEHTIDGLLSNREYLMWVETIGEYGKVNSSLFYARTLLPPPLPPSNLEVTIEGQQRVRLDWVDNASDENGYLVLRSVENENDFKQVADLGSNITQWADSLVGPDTTYVYLVGAYSHETGYSLFIQSEVYIELLVPEAPSNLSVIPFGQSQSKLSWTDNSLFESGFEVLRGAAGSELVPIGTVNANVKEFLDSDWPDNVEAYRYAVRAINAVGASEMSNEVSFTVLGISNGFAGALTIYPSPIKNELNISLPSGTYDLRVINSKGIEILQMPLEGSETIDCSNWSSGIYLLYISNGDGQMVQKVFKE